MKECCSTTEHGKFISIKSKVFIRCLEFSTWYSLYSPNAEKSHYHFYYLHSKKSYEILQFSKGRMTSADSTTVCDVCQRMAKRRSRVRVTLPHGDIICNRTLCSDLFTIEWKSVLHTLGEIQSSTLLYFSVLALRNSCRVLIPQSCLIAMLVIP